MNKHLVLQSDFGLVDGAVAAMYGVALDVSATLKVYDLTHEIPPYDIFAASYRLIQTLQYWPAGTVFVSVVDPGVGSNRKSVVAKTSSGHYVVTPDNGTLTHIKRLIGIEEVREIEEAVHRRKNTEHSYTFHGRDVYAFTGAKLAADLITFEEVGQLLSVERVVEVDLAVAQQFENRIVGCVDILDVRFGSCWTNISREMFSKLGVEFGEMVEVSITNGHIRVYQNHVCYGPTFAQVNVGEVLLYTNSMYHMALAINQGNFARAYNIGTGPQWKVELKKVVR